MDSMENEIHSVQQETFMYFPCWTCSCMALIPPASKENYPIYQGGFEKKKSTADSLKEMKGSNKLFNFYLKLFNAQYIYSGSLLLFKWLFSPNYFNPFPEEKKTNSTSSFKELNGGIF